MLTASRVLLIHCCLLILVLANTSCRKGEEGAAGQRTTRANRLVVSKSAGPRTFNRLLSSDEQTNSIGDCLMGRLIRINRQTQKPEAELATSWELSPDGKTLTCELRRDTKFSDGAPFTADDVIFTFQVLNDPAVASPAAVDFDGQPMKVEKLDSHKVRFLFPQPHAAAERLFDGIPILPKHILEPGYREGKFAQSWTLATPPEQIVGLGPFKMKEFVTGQRITLARNEHYWKTDAAGKRLPYLDEIIFNIDPDRDTQRLKFQQGETDLLSPVTADDAAALGPLEQQGKIKLIDLGPSLIREILWFNINDGKQKNGKPYVDPVKLGWFKDVRFRQAISHAIDRDAIVKLVFAGKASPQYGFLSAGDKLWLNAEVKKYPYDLGRAKSLLTESGFRLQNDNELVDPQSRPVNFTLITNAGNAIRQKMSAMIQADLARLGIKVNLAMIESRALISTIQESLNYEAGLLAIVSGDADPTSHINILSSGGHLHWWQPRQNKPVTEWEGRIDELMEKQKRTLDPAERKKLFDEVQMIMAEQQPFIFLASRHLIVAAKSDIDNLKPALLPDFVLWNAEELKRR